MALPARLLLAIALTSCGNTARATQALEPCCCPCQCAPADAGADATHAIDASPDASPDALPGTPPIGLSLPWSHFAITPGSGSTGLFRGADGVEVDSEGCWWTAWEQGGAVTRACGSGTTWSTEVVATALVGAEDAKPMGDLDGDGSIDGAVSIDAIGGTAYLLFRGVSPATITLGASQGHCSVMQLAGGDIDADGDTDLVMGTRWRSGCASNVTGVVAWLENPGPENARIGLLWVYHQIRPAGWAMTVRAIDVNGDGRLDVVVSDRAAYKDAAGVTRWDLYGAQWSEQQLGGAWGAHSIGYPAGSCNPLPYTSPTCAKTPGDEMMLDIVSIVGSSQDWLVIDGQSNGGQSDSRILWHELGAGTHALIPPVTNVGHYQHAVTGDVDGDGDLDLVVSTWITNNPPPLTATDAAKSWLYWLRNNGDGTWSRGEISGPGAGAKGDNVAWLGAGPCVIASEQLDPAGGRGVEAWCPPGVTPR